MHLTKVQLVCTLRHLRIEREAVLRNIVALEEQLKSGWNGDRVSAARQLDADLMILDEVIRLCWVEMLSHETEHPSGPHSTVPNP
jgi:hypothetical protein